MYICLLYFAACFDILIYVYIASDKEVPSAHVPPLRGQSMVWTGQELVVFGGAVAEQPGYHGIRNGI